MEPQGVPSLAARAVEYWEEGHHNGTMYFSSELPSVPLLSGGVLKRGCPSCGGGEKESLGLKECKRRRRRRRRWKPRTRDNTPCVIIRTDFRNVIFNLGRLEGYIQGTTATAATWLQVQPDSARVYLGDASASEQPRNHDHHRNFEIAFLCVARQLTNANKGGRRWNLRSGH